MRKSEQTHPTQGFSASALRTFHVRHRSRSAAADVDVILVLVQFNVFGSSSSVPAVAVQLSFTDRKLVPQVRDDAHVVTRAELRRR